MSPPSSSSSSRGPAVPISPPPPPSRPPPPPPTPAAHQSGQIKVKVQAPKAGQRFTLVVPLNITCEALRSRIDTKLQRSSNISLADDASHQVVLKWLRGDDFVAINTDDDVREAFEGRTKGTGLGIAGMDEVELFCQ